MIERKLLKAEQTLTMEYRRAQQKLASIKSIKEIVLMLDTTHETIPDLPAEKLLELLEHLAERSLEPNERNLIHELAEA